MTALRYCHVGAALLVTYSVWSNIGTDKEWLLSTFVDAQQAVAWYDVKVIMISVLLFNPIVFKLDHTTPLLSHMYD